MRATIFCLFTLAALAPRANAQCNLSPSDPIRQVMGPVCGQKAELDGYYATRRVLAEAGSWISEIGDGARYAYGASRAAAEAGYRDGYGRRGGMSRTQGAILGGSIGANIGGVVTGDRKWMGIGAGGGALVGALLAGRGGHDEYGRPKSLDCSKKKNREACAAIAAEQVAAERAAQVQAEMAERQRMAILYYNRTGRPVDVWDGNVRVAFLHPGEPTELPEPRSGYRAMRHLKTLTGRTVFLPAENRLERDGSISFVVPVGEGR